MDRWLVTQGSDQFAVNGLDELRQLARAGRLKAGDMVQPPGATDWLYASELPELKGMLKQTDDDDDDAAPRSVPVAVYLGAAVVLLVVLVAGGGAMYSFYQTMSSDAPKLLGEGGMSYSEMLVTQPDAPLLAEAAAGASTVTTLQKDSSVELLSKRGEYYRARPKGGGPEGWVKIDHVIPMYQLGGAKVREEFDPLYNPDQYTTVQNASWSQIDAKNAQLTVFQFMLNNKSRYPMTDLVLLATVKDAKGAEIERVEIAVEGEIPAWSATMVGTFEPDKKSVPAGEEPVKKLMTTYSFNKLSETDPDLQLQWADGVEVEMKAKDFTTANIDIIELRAIPEAQPKPKSGRR